MPLGEKLAAFEALFWLALARLIILNCQFSKISKYLGQSGLDIPPDVFPKGKEPIVGLVERSLKRVQPYTPWDSNCLAQAFTARQMLKHRGLPATIYLGVAFKEDRSDLIAHAWLRTGRWVITGWAERTSFRTVAVFGTLGKG